MPNWSCQTGFANSVLLPCWSESLRGLSPLSNGGENGLNMDKPSFDLLQCRYQNVVPKDVAAMKPYLLRLHRWISLLFALPLAVVIVTGLILSVQPMLQNIAIKPGSIDGAKVEALLQKFDPDSKARGLTIDPFANQMRLQGAGVSVNIDLATGEAVAAPSALNSLFGWARGTHQRIISGFGWLVTASTIAMLVIIALGVLMGLPRLRNSLSGWHKGMAWFALPLVVLSPLTGLFLALDISIGASGLATPPGRPVPLKEAVRMIAAQHDMSRVSSLGIRGGRMLARIDQGGDLTAFSVTAQGLTPAQRNWSRILHEGTWSALVAGGLNVLVSLVLAGLLTTGVIIWGRRSLRRPQRTRHPARPSADHKIEAA